jgi:hypothetical protein
MGKLWRVDIALEDSEGLRWIRERLGAYDWSKVDWITLAPRTERETRVPGRVQVAFEGAWPLPDQLQR